jgi:hypothetical protein
MAYVGLCFREAGVPVKLPPKTRAGGSIGAIDFWNSNWL